MKLLIKKGHVLDPASDRDGYFDILVKDGRIEKVAPLIETAADQVIDAGGFYVMPGFVDLHVHLREPGYEYKETIRTGSWAAARGGFTSVCPMPNTNPVTDSRYMAEYIRLKAEKEAAVNIWPVGAVTAGQNGLEVSDIAGMVKAGIVAISEDGKSVMDTGVYLSGMRRAAMAGIPVLAHCEDKRLAGAGAVNAGPAAARLKVEGIPNAAEDVIAARDILLAGEAGARLHLCHCSTRDSVILVKTAKEAGLMITAEVCPHHFTLTDEDITGDDANYKMNPPLRSKKDVEALKKALRDDIIDVIATDHAPHSEEEKKKPIKDAPFGISGLETAFALAVTQLVEPGYLTKRQLVEKMSQNPAGVIGIDRGTLLEGRPADIVIADFSAEYIIHKEQFLSMGKNTPFDGKRVRGRIEKTIAGGRLVYERRENDND